MALNNGELTDALKPETTPIDNVGAKVNMYERMHGDLGKAKILSLKPVEEKLEMEVERKNGGVLKITLTFLKNSPYLINGFSVQLMIGR